MAGTPEKSTDQLQLPPAKYKINKICNDYLLNTLSKTRLRENVSSADFEILSGFIKFETKAKIPDNLTKTLGLQDFRWTRFSHREALPALFVGKKSDGEYITNNYEDALATIEVGRWKQFDKSINGWKDIPAYVRIAGIDKQQDRIVAATYDLTENNRLTRLNVSIPDSELNLNDESDSNYLPRLSLISLLSSKSIIPLAFSEKRPYFTAGLITPQMREAAKTNDHAFSFEIDSKGNVSPKRPDVGSNTAAEAFKTFSELGYYTRREDGLIIIGLGKSLAFRRRVDPWEISVPEFLQKANLTA
jgi:hypothetical protein